MESPNSLKPPKPATVRMKKWPLAVVALMLIGLGSVLYYSVNRKPVEKAPEKKSESAVTSQQFANVEGHGLASLPPNSPAVVTPPPPPGEKKDKPLVVVRDDQEAHRDELRRQQAKEQAYMTALTSPLLAKRSTAAPSTSSAEARPAAAPGAVAQPAVAAVDPSTQEGSADREKEQFFDRASAGKNEWLSPYTREAGHPFEIKTGTVIPGIMISGINSDLPGHLIAQVAQSVYDTATGQHLIVPQGAKLFGRYDSRVVYGQERVLIAWNRLVFPDGSAVTLGAMPGADMEGYAGFHDQVDNHYLRIFGSALLMSMITGGSSYAMDSVSNSDQDNNKTTVQDAMASALAAQMGQTTMTLLQKNLNIKPTLEIRPGYQFNVIVTKDVVFREPWRSNG